MTEQLALSLSLGFLDEPADHLAGDRARDRGLNGLFYSKMFIVLVCSFRLNPPG